MPRCEICQVNIKKRDLAKHEDEHEQEQLQQEFKRLKSAAKAHYSFGSSSVDDIVMPDAESSAVTADLNLPLVSSIAAATTVDSVLTEVNEVVEEIEEPLHEVEEVNAYLEDHLETVDRPLEVNLDISSELLNQHEKINIDFKMMIREKKITNDAEATIVKWINQLLKSPGYGKFVNAFCAARIVVY